MGLLNDCHLSLLTCTFMYDTLTLTFTCSPDCHHPHPFITCFLSLCRLSKPHPPSVIDTVTSLHLAFTHLHSHTHDRHSCSHISDSHVQCTHAHIHSHSYLHTDNHTKTHNIRLGVFTCTHLTFAFYIYITNFICSLTHILMHTYDVHVEV